MKAKKVLGLFSEKYKEPSVCESCGEEFSCGATLKGCWCMNVDLTDETRADLKTKFERCLCRACLEKLSKQLS